MIEKKIIAIVRDELSLSFLNNVCELEKQDYCVNPVMSESSINEGNILMFIFDCEDSYYQYSEEFKNVPFLFIKKNISLDMNICFHKNFLGIFFLNPTDAMGDNGICMSYYQPFYYSKCINYIGENKLPQSYDRSGRENVAPNIIVVLDRCKRHLIYQYIRFFNLYGVFNVKICNVKNAQEYEVLLNNNISLEITLTSDLFDKFDVVITSGTKTLDALSIGKPVFVIGEKGYGGLITGDNFNYLMSTNFSGRYGANYGEPILEQVFFHDLNGLIDRDWNQHELELNHVINDYASGALKKAREFIRDRIEICKSINNRSFNNLYPILCKNIEGIVDKNQVILRILPFRTKLGIIDTDVYELISSFEGKKNCQTIIEDHDIEESVFFGFLLNLFEKKVINFSMKSS